GRGAGDVDVLGDGSCISRPTGTSRSMPWLECVPFARARTALKRWQKKVNGSEAERSSQRLLSEPRSSRSSEISRRRRSGIREEISPPGPRSRPHCEPFEVARWGAWRGVGGGGVRLESTVLLRRRGGR